MARKRGKPRQKRLPSGDIERIQSGLVTVTRYRDHKTGRYIKKPRRITRRYRREKYEYRVRELGEFASGWIVPLEETEARQIGTIDLDNWQGHVKSAMMANNIFATASSRNAQMVDIRIEGWYGKTRIVIKKSLDLRDITKRRFIGDLMVGKILERLHALGYRTQYALEPIRWTPKLTPHSRKKDTEARRPLTNAVISFRIRY